MVDFNKDIGSKIVLARKAVGLSQRQLAHRLSISQQVLSGYECGKTSVSLKVFVDICSALDAPISWFLSSIKQYGDVIGSDEIELLNELKRFTDTSTLLNFIRQCNAKKQSNVKIRRCLPKKTSGE